MKLKIAFISDWHIGEGAGVTGHIDRVVRRHPQDDLPYVPAKTITGLLRDACEKVANGLDEGDGHAWQDFVAQLFGQRSKGVDDPANTSAALVRITEARFEEGLRKAIQTEPDIKAALTFVKPGIALDEDGMAKSNMLRMEEVVIAGSELEATIELDDTLAPEVRESVLAILAAGCRAVERIGAKRRRGNGRCELTLEGAGDNWSLLATIPPQITIPTARSGMQLSTTEIASSGSWHVIPLDISLLSPVVIPAGTAGNVIETRDHIPGTLLLPALDKKLRTLLADKANELTSHLAAGRIQIRNAYPVGGAQRLLPAPAALMAEKDRAGVVINELYGHPDDKIQRKQLRVGYVPIDLLPPAGDGKTPVQKVSTVATTHAVIDPKVQRPTEDVGGVYTYEAIAPGQMFRSELWINKAVLENLPQESDLSGVIRIGRAKKDDYGRVRIEVGKQESENRTVIHDGKFTLWLASPLLARDERLRPITDAVAFTSWLNWKLKASLTLKKSFVRSVRDDGWNNAWNEPRPTRFGLAAGSCFLFEGAVDVNYLETLMKQGMGERTGEGYGEVILNAPLLKDTEVGRYPESKEEQNLKSSSQTQTVAASPFVKRLHHRAWRNSLRQQVQAKAAERAKDLGWTDTKPENSQLGALRSQFENWQGAAPFKSWLDHLMEKPNRKDKWPQKSLEKLEKQSMADDFVWQNYFTELPQLPNVDLGKLNDEMNYEATRIFWLTVIGVELDRRALAEKKNTNKKEGV